MSDSESDEFQSADEFVSDDEFIDDGNDTKRVDICEAVDDTLEVNSRNNVSVVEEDLELPSLICEKGDSEDPPSGTRSYRKRPERTRKSIESTSSLQTHGLKHVIDVVKVARPDDLIKGLTNQITTNISKGLSNRLTNHLTSNISKGISTFQETSSSLKGFVLGELPIETLTFNYDDDRGRSDDAPTDSQRDSNEPTTIQSSLNEEILKLSDAFAKLNEARNDGPNIESAALLNQIREGSEVDSLNVSPKPPDQVDSTEANESLNLENKPFAENNPVVSPSEMLQNDLPIACDIKSNVDEVNVISHADSKEVVDENKETISKIEKDTDYTTAEFENAVNAACDTETSDPSKSAIEEKGGDEKSNSEEHLNSFVLTQEVADTLSGPELKNIESNPAFSEDLKHSVDKDNENVGWDNWDESEDDEYSSQVIPEHVNKIKIQSTEEIRLVNTNISCTENFQKVEDESFKASAGAEVDITGWDNWNDDEIEVVADNEISTMDNSKFSKICSSTDGDKVLEQSASTNKESKSTVTDDMDEWGRWNDEFEENPNKALSKNSVEVIEKEKIKAVAENSGASVAANVEGDLDGWDDWGDEDIDNESPVEKVKSSDEQTTKVKREDDGWGDWGSDDDDVIKPVSEMPALDVKRNSQQEWRGWDSFGQKKDKDWGWGLSTIVNTATAVATNVTAVTQGLSNVLETGLGVPDPETMARIYKKEEDEIRKLSPERLLPDVEDRQDMQFPFKQFVTGVGKIVEVAKVQEIGSKVISGGLDTLESIGKKTMEVLQEGDPGLKKKRATLVGKGQALSQVLREAKERAAAEERRSGELSAKKRFHLETLFDDFHGLVHLEALEMLSRQCELRLEQILAGLPPSKAKEIKDTMEEVEQLCEIDEEFGVEHAEDFKEALIETISPLQNELSVAKIVEVHEKLIAWLESETDGSTHRSIYEKALSMIAELAAACTQQFHKAGELLILKERRKTVEEADCLLQLSSHLCAEMNATSDRVAALLSKNQTSESEMLISNFKVETENASAYIKQAFGLMTPVLQLGAT